MADIRDLIWDFDGTLYDTYGAIVSAFASVLREGSGIEVAREHLHELVKIDTQHCAAQLASRHELDGAALLKAARAAYDASAMGQHPYPDVPRALRLIEAGGGRNFLVTHRDRASLQRLLAQEGLQDAFCAILCADDVFPLKPSPASFQYLIERHALLPANTVAIGDRDLDVQAANSAGIHSIFFDVHGATHPSAATCISDFGQLCTLLQEPVHGLWPADRL